MEKGGENGATLLAELRALRKGRGVSLTRLRDSPLVLEALGTDDPRLAQRLLTQALVGLGEDMPAQALRHAYAIDLTAASTLTTRRNNFAVLNNKSPDTIEAYENAMIDELAEWLKPSPSSPAEFYVILSEGAVSRAVARRVKDGEVEIAELDIDQLLDSEGFQITCPIGWDRNESVKVVVLFAEGDIPDDLLVTHRRVVGRSSGPRLLLEIPHTVDGNRVAVIFPFMGFALENKFAWGELEGG